MTKLIATDCDGVLFKWEEMFDKYMKINGFEKKTQDHYELHMNYQMPVPEMQVLVKIFNESAYMRYLEPIEGAVEYVKKLADEGWRFHVITSQSTDKIANQARKDNLKDVFGDVFEDFTFLDTGGGKIDALKTLVPGTWWIEDKPKNAFDGAVLGLASILLDLPHNSSYTINKQMHFQRAKNLEHISRENPGSAQRWPRIGESCARW